MSTSNPFVASDDEQWFVPGPRWWSGVLGVFDALAVAWLARDAAAGIRAIDRFGRRVHATGLVPPTVDDVRTLFPWCDDAVSHRIARESAALRFKNRAAIALLQRRGIAALAELTVTPRPIAGPLAGPARGVILLAFHMGAQFGVGATLHRWGVRSLTVRNLPVGHAHERTRALRQAVDELRAGAAIITAVDGPGGVSTRPTGCFGRQVVLRRGPFMLARMMRVPLLPVVARWTPSGHIALDVGGSLAPPGDGPADEIESRLAAEAAAWFESELTAHPGDLWPYTLANLLATPRDEAIAT